MKVARHSKNALPPRPRSENFARILIYTHDATRQYHRRGKIGRFGRKVGNDRRAIKLFRNRVADFAEGQHAPTRFYVRKMRVEQTIQFRLKRQDAAR